VYAIFFAQNILKLKKI